jgi:diguanylate cyclase (GGDEF)-like protein/PAS domain S-box-containing protein
LENLDSEQDLYKVILENISDGVYFCNHERRVVYWNAGAERITGYSAEQVRGSSCADGILMHVDERGTSLCQAGCPLSATLADGQPREAHAYLHHRAGHRVPVLLRTNPIYTPNGDVEGVVETFSDNSALLSALRRVDELSLETETDPLTEVGNRRSMIVKLDASVSEKRRARATTGVLFVDIDHFKNINDTYGHDTGDRVLKMVAQTLKHNLRATDGLARWGGEEFLALLLHTNESSLAATAEKLRTLVASSYLKVDNTDIRVTISLGATLIRSDDTRESLVARADALLYRSKSEGRDRYTLEI